MMILGAVLLVLGLLLSLELLALVGLVLLAVGLVFLLAAAAGHPVGGRRRWY